MRFGPDDETLWVVTDPGPRSELGDILFRASLRDLELQFKGGLSMDRNPTLFTDRAEAEVEAHARLVARASANAIRAAAADGVQLMSARRIQILGEGGKVLFESEFSQ